MKRADICDLLRDTARRVRLSGEWGELADTLDTAAAEIVQARRVELDYNDGLTLVAVRELLARKTTPELVGTLRDLAMDYRLDLMPVKFRYVMQEAAHRLELNRNPSPNPLLTDEERSVLEVCATHWQTAPAAKTIRALIARLD
jgi:hypothetical protein